MTARLLTVAFSDIKNFKYEKTFPNDVLNITEVYTFLDKELRTQLTIMYVRKSKIDLVT